MKNYCALMFGSQLNSTFDIYSDKDLLVVSDSMLYLKELYKDYTSKGWSVSCYTFSKLQFLSNRGSLFLSHLQNDAIITYDPNNQLKEILDNHKSKQNYNIELLDSIDYFNILQYIPDNNLSYGWFCDCFYVGLRNYLIFKNANNEIYEFNYLRLLNLLVLNNSITELELETLRQLRVIKHNYRNEINDELPSKDFVKKIICIAQKMGLLNQSKFVKSDEFKNVFDNITIGKFNGYQRLRLIEGYYCSQNIDIPMVKNVISNPQFYSSMLLNEKYLKKILYVIDDELNRTGKFISVEKFFIKNTCR